MLSQIVISNIAVIEHCEVNMNKSFNVLTGETGAGKSLIIDSLNMVLGERGNRELIRHGAKSAKVEALFYLEGDALNAVSETVDGIEGGELLLCRELFDDGRNVCKINGSLATVATLREVGKLIVNIHGQHDGQKLLNQANHIDYLDKYAKNTEISDKYKKLYDEKRNLEKQLAEITTGELERQQRLDILKHWSNEIETAALREGEDEELTDKRDKMRNYEKLRSAVIAAYEALYASDGAAFERLSDASSNIEAASSYDRELEPLSEEVKDALYKIEDASRELSAYCDSMEYDPSELEYITDRLDLIFRLKSKYGQSIGEILEYQKKCDEEIAFLENAEENASEIQKCLDIIEGEIKKAAEELTKTRQNAAQNICKAVQNELSDLDMQKVKFDINIEEIQYSPNGCDRVEFMISTNPSEPLKPLHKIASGGEMSRICLALKTVLSDEDTVPTLVFDEIDTGVSGRAAQRIGEKMKKLGAKKQIISITHLPQIASLADSHYLIQKNDFSTTVTLLERSSRIDEIARIISGSDITETAKSAAEEMLDKASVV
ncbi:MAG: DNA repair protein RecN [Clostridia bacterium]|nr:DNA repair protein RecN [Clostridia bacterium]